MKRLGYEMGGGRISASRADVVYEKKRERECDGIIVV